MKTPKLSRRFLPATLFLLAAGMRAQSTDLLDGGMNAPAVETVSGPQIVDSQPVGAKPAVASRLSPKEQELLKRFDLNHDGKLDDHELALAHEAIRQEEAGKAVDNARRLYARLLEKFDTERKGNLSPTEQADAVAFLETNYRGVYQKLVQKFDRNGDGKLDADETQAMFTTLAQAPAIGQGAKDASPVPAPRAAGVGRGMMARRIYERLLAAFDQDHDGTLDAAEQANALAYLKAHNPRLYDGMVQRYDTDGDGTLDAAESQALFNALAKLPPSGPSPAAGPGAAPTVQEKS